MTVLRKLALAVAATLGLTAAVEAHPHIFIDARAVLVFNDAGELAAIRNSWTFDEAFSVWQVQGLDTNGDGITSSEEMQELADENVQGLAEYGFYTSAGDRSGSIPFERAEGGRFVFENNRSTLSFTAAPATPHRLDGKLELSIADPEYYIAINFAGPGDVTLENAPAGCTVTLQPPRELSPELQEQLFQLSPDVTKLPPDLEVAVRGTQGLIVLDCPQAAPAPAAATALEAVAEVAEAKPALPFGGPPPEPGFRISRSGPLGWLVVAQEQFYLGLTAALNKLKSDWNAFWVLGGLSFLYGVFHAAGPGHGKVVIGSYMLANERQLRRGVALSFAAALLQSVVAVVFVGIAAAILGLSSAVMDNAVGWIDKASYALIALLGIWLVARKIFGWGHSHAHASDLPSKARRHLHVGSPSTDAHGRLPGDPHYGHDHGDHDHDHGHAHHVVTPDQTGGDWGEQLGVVLSVGIRPCSGALIVLVFALSQGVLPAGIAAVFLMGLGTAITVATLAVMAVGAKGAAQRYLGAGGAGERIVWWAELIGAVIVFLFGALLLLASF